jgi:hypothetical protein
MRNIINLAPLTKPLRIKGGYGVSTLHTLADAGAFLQRFGNEGQLHWEVAAAALDAADKDPKLIDHATRAMENALKTDNLLLD